MTPQRDPATVRAVLNKHTNDNDRPSACETCCLADELRHIHTLARRWHCRLLGWRARWCGSGSTCDVSWRTSDRRP